MIQNMMTKKDVKQNKSITRAQKEAKKYYGDKLFDKKHNEPKAKIRKMVSIGNISFKDMVNEKSAEITQMPSKEELIKLCEDNRLTGGSGNGFPVSDKLKSFKTENGILIINAVECDPGLVQDAWIYRNKLAEVEKGVEILENAFHFARRILVTKEPLKSGNKTFEQIKVKDRFPMGYENFIIRTVLDKEVPEGKLPSDIGVLVVNIQTVLMLAGVAANPAESDNRYFTVADMNNALGCVVKAKIGTSIEEIVRTVFPGKNIATGEIVTGGGVFMCDHITSEQCITNETAFIGIGKMHDHGNARNCGGCGACISSCPAGVTISKIMQHVDKNGMSDAKACSIFNPDKCIGCGACSYVCRAGKDTRAIVMWAKENQ